MPHIDRSNTKSARALELHEKGIETWAIAERLGVNVGHVATLIVHGRRSRARKQKSVQEA